MTNDQLKPFVEKAISDTMDDILECEGSDVYNGNQDAVVAFVGDASVIFEKGWSDEEAKKECVDNYGPSMALNDDLVSVCDDCYQKIRPDQHPEVLQKAKDEFEGPEDVEIESAAPKIQKVLEELRKAANN